MSRVDIEEIWPPFRLRVEVGDLVLSPMREADLPELIEIVLEGIHDPARMPFGFPWTDAPRDQLSANYVRYFGQLMATGPDILSLQLVVRRTGDVLGVQGLDSEGDYLTTRTLETGSWLGRRFQGQGLGTRMRQAACAFAFDELGAERIVSHAFLDNPASAAVSRKVGYRANGRRWLARRGAVAEEAAFVLTEPDLRRGEAIEVTGAAEFRRFIGVG